jgi:hypothetical protein
MTGKSLVASSLVALLGACDTATPDTSTLNAEGSDEPAVEHHVVSVAVRNQTPGLVFRYQGNETYVSGQATADGTMSMDLEVIQGVWAARAPGHRDVCGVEDLVPATKSSGRRELEIQLHAGDTPADVGAAVAAVLPAGFELTNDDVSRYFDWGETRELFVTARFHETSLLLVSEVDAEANLAIAPSDETRPDVQLLIGADESRYPDGFELALDDDTAWISIPEGIEDTPVCRAWAIGYAITQAFPDAVVWHYPWGEGWAAIQILRDETETEPDAVFEALRAY